jgi:BirA family biotin operon repressor/biotin-[acetyl-CoA-carboxylase] ligase
MIPLIRLGAIDSTQSFLARHPELGFCGVMADAQTEGRGRGGNTWESKAGAGLWLSARLPLTGETSGNLLQKAMAAVLDVLEPCGLTLGLKWPNDLVAYQQIGQRRSLVKVGGIIGDQKDGSLILGLGLNLFDAPEIPDRVIPPASLLSLGASDIPDAAELAMRILSEWLVLTTERLVVVRWPGQGDAIRWEDGRGVCQGWEPDGRLAVQTQSGLLRLAHVSELCPDNPSNGSDV